VLRLQAVELPASDHTSPYDGTRLAMDRRRRDNIARRCWRLVYVSDGTSARVGLFVGVEAAETYAHEHGWTVLPVIDEPGSARVEDRSAGPRPGRDDVDAAAMPPVGDTGATSPTLVDVPPTTAGGFTA